MAFAAGLTALAVSLLGCELGRRLGPKVGLVDAPDGDLKTHGGVIVPLGGFGVLAGLLTGLGVAGRIDAGIVIAGVLVWLMGLVDDRKGLSPLIRLVGGLLAGVALVAFSDPPASGFLLQVFWVMVTLVAVNAVNLFDGLDGLAVSAAAGATVALTAFGFQLGASTEAAMPLVGAFVGFAFFNWPPARMFLGDNGAYFVAVALVWFGMQVSGASMGQSLVGAALLGLPVLDLVSTIVRRAHLGERLFSGDRDHGYDLLHGRGVTGAIMAGLVFVAQVLWGTALLAAYSSGAAPLAVAVAIVGGVAYILWMHRMGQQSRS